MVCFATGVAGLLVCRAGKVLNCSRALYCYNWHRVCAVPGAVAWSPVYPACCAACICKLCAC